MAPVHPFAGVDGLHRSPSRVISRRSVLGLATAAGAVTALAACGGAEGSVSTDHVLSVSLNQTETHPSYLALTKFGELLREATNGRWGARVYPNESLGAQQEVVQLVADGAVDMAVISSPQMENLSLRFRPLNLPGVFTDSDHQAAVLKDESIVGELFESLVESKNLRVIGGLTQGSRHMYTKAPVSSPDDLAGKKIRVQESDVFISLMRAMSASPTPMAYGEVYTALQAGVLDGAENNEISYVTQRHYEVAKHFTLTNHLVGLDYVVAGENTLKKMRADDREAFLDCFTKAQDYFVELWKSETDKAIDAMKEAGSTIHEIDPSVFGPAIDSVAEQFLTTPEDEELYTKVREHESAKGDSK